MSVTIEIDRDADQAKGRSIDLADLVEMPRNLTALDVFSTKFEDGKKHPIDDILSRVRDEIEAFGCGSDFDLSSPSVRKSIASMAYRVSQAKSAIEKVGSDVAAKQKDIPKRIDITRKYAKDKLDAWRDEVRQPLTEWEAAEDARVTRIKAVLAALQETIDIRGDHSSDVLANRLASVEAIDLSEARWNEYLGAATEMKNRAVDVLNHNIETARKREAEAAELAALRAEKAKREQEEREADEAAERAARERKIAEQAAQLAAQAERDAAELRERQLKAEVAAAEQRAIDAAKKAKDDVEAKARAEELDRQKREADKSHKAKINRAAVAALVAHGIGEDVAKSVVTLIVLGKVPSVRVSY